MIYKLIDWGDGTGSVCRKEYCETDGMTSCLFYDFSAPTRWGLSVLVVNWTAPIEEAKRIYEELKEKE